MYGCRRCQILYPLQRHLCALDVFACTQANENENEALPSHKLGCSLKDNPIDFFYVLAMSLECLAKIMTES